jgi:hypothetical protein
MNPQKAFFIPSSLKLHLFMLLVHLIIMIHQVVGVAHVDDPTTTEDPVEVEKKATIARLQDAYIAARSGLSTRKLYPHHLQWTKILKRYSETPFPFLFGPSIYFFCLVLIFISWYIKYCVGKALRSIAETIDLFPETNRFPNVNLYSLQQSKREARLRREARNTWAWMARKYLLLPNDPNVSSTVFSTTWSDFDLPKNVWGIVRAVMKVNAWYNRARGRLKGVLLTRRASRRKSEIPTRRASRRKSEIPTRRASRRKSEIQKALR